MLKALKMKTACVVVQQKNCISVSLSNGGRLLKATGKATQLVALPSRAYHEE
jgi:hypothetical protein